MVKLNALVSLLAAAAAFQVSSTEAATVTATGPSHYQPAVTYNTGLNVAGQGSTQAESALAFLQKQLKPEGPVSVMANTLSTTQSFTDSHSGTYYMYAKPVHNGLNVENAGVQVAVDRNNNVVTYSSAWKKDSLSILAVTDSTPTLSAKDAVKSFAKSIGVTLSDSRVKVEAGQTEVNGVNTDPTVTGVYFAMGGQVKTNLKYYQTPDNALELVWSLDMEMINNWLNVFVSAKDGRVVAISDWVSDSKAPRALANGEQTVGSFELEIPDSEDVETVSSRDLAAANNNQRLRRNLQTGVSGVKYRVNPIGKNDPSEGRELLVDPQDLKYSPKGWHDSGSGPQGVLTGNNAKATNGGNTAVTASDFNFDFPLDATAAPKSYAAAATTNMFYVTNAIHDLYYAYGFTSAAGNFETVSSAGRGNDAVVATAQDTSGTNNANFATPPDGSPGRMRMYIFTYTTPNRDGALENDIVIHELTHGLSNRLTGGAANSNCLNSGESGGMGEGWGDFYGNALRIKPTDTRKTVYGLGTYVLGSNKGIRKYPYSTDTSADPHMYSMLKTSTEVHFIGEVWASMLNELFWNLVDKYGFSTDFKNAKSGKGNTLAFQLVMDSLKLQPCNPTLVQSRDAIIQADKNLNNGANFCEIWKAFAKRGLGLNAKAGTYTDNLDLPAQCTSGGPGTTAAPATTAPPTTTTKPPTTTPAPGPTTKPPTTTAAPTPGPTTAPPSTCNLPKWLCCIVYNQC